MGGRGRRLRERRVPGREGREEGSDGVDAGAPPPVRRGVAHLGDKGAVPKAIVRLMNVEGLTRENVASHLQKYRIYLKRTRSTPMRQPPPPSFLTAYASPFNPHPPSDASNQRGYCSFPSRDCEKLERDHAVSSTLWFSNFENAFRTKVKPLEGDPVSRFISISSCEK